MKLYAVLFSLYMLEFQLFFYLEGTIDGVLSRGHYAIWIVVSAGFLLFGASRAAFSSLRIRQFLLMCSNIVYALSMVFIMFFGTEMPFLFLLTAGVSLGCLGGAVYYFMAVEFYMKNNAGLVMALAAAVPYILQQLLTPLMGNKLINFAILVVLFCTITFFAIAHPNDFILDDSLPFAEETSDYRRSLVSDKLRVLIMFPAALIIAIYMEYTWGEALLVEAVNMYGWQRFAAILGCFYIGCLADYKKHRYMDVALVAAFLLYAFGTYLPGEAGMRLAFFYFLAGVYTGYLNIAFWFLAPKTRHPELWACLGRVLSLFEGFAAMVIGIVGGGSIAVRIITNISLLTMVLCLYALKGRGVTDWVADNSELSLVTGQVVVSNDDCESPSETKDGQETEKEAGESEKFAAFCSSHSMTPRECDVMKLILSSDENMKILSEKLGISERMLYRYMNSLYSKVGTENRAGLIKKYYEL